MQTQITVTVDGRNVISYLHRAGAKTLVMIIHGHNTDGTRGRFIELAKSLEHLGVDALRFNVAREKVGNETYMVTSVTEEAAQARAVLEKLRPRYDKIVVMGHSQASMICLHLRDLADGIVFLHGVFNPEWHIDAKARFLDKTLEEMHKGAKSVLTLPNGKTFVYSAAYFDDLIMWKPLDMLPSYEKPTLFFGARRDSNVPLDEVKHGFSIAHEPKAFVELMGEHNFSTDESTIIAKETIAWMQKNNLCIKKED